MNCSTYVDMVAWVSLVFLLFFVFMALSIAMISSKIKNTLSASKKNDISFGFFSTFFDHDFKRKVELEYKNNKDILPLVARLKKLTISMTLVMIALLLLMIFIGVCNS